MDPAKDKNMTTFVNPMASSSASVHLVPHPAGGAPSTPEALEVQVKVEPGARCIVAVPDRTFLAWFRAEGCAGVLAATTLSILIFHLAFMIVLHTTPIADSFTGINFRKVMNITPATAVSVGIACGAALVYATRCLYLVTCGHVASTEATIRQFVDPRRPQSRICRRISWLWAWMLRPGAPYYELFEFTVATLEICLQAAAVRDYANEGMSRPFLAIYIAVIFCNGQLGVFHLWQCPCSKSAWRRVVDHDFVSQAGRLRIIIAVDVLCDVFYGVVPFYVITTKCFRVLFSVEQSEQTLCKIVGFRGLPCWELLLQHLQAWATLVLFGGVSTWDVAFKLVTRVTPIYFAATRLVDLVRLRALALHRQQQRKLNRAKGVTQFVGRLRPTVTTTKPLPHTSSFYTLSMAEARRARPRHIFCGAVALRVVAVAVVSCFAWIRLGTVSEGCFARGPEPAKWTTHCVVPAFPIFDSALPQQGYDLEIDDSSGSSADDGHSSSSNRTTVRVPSCPCNQLWATAATCSSPHVTKAWRVALFGSNSIPASRYIKVLQLRGCSLDNAMVNEIVANLPGMVVLNLKGSTNITSPPLALSLPPGRDPRNGGHLASLATLRLENMGIASAGLPGWFEHLSSLRALSIERDRLTSGSIAVLERMPFLVMVRLDHNDLTELPQWFGRLRGLAHLRINSNRLVTLPRELGRLTDMRDLQFSDNEVTHLPSWIGSLTALTTLAVEMNRVTSLPSELGRLTGIQALLAAQNYLTGIPAELRSMQRLRAISLSGNRLRSLHGWTQAAANTATSIAQQDKADIGTTWPQLKDMDVSNNLLTELPAGWVDALQSGRGVANFEAEIRKLRTLAGTGTLRIRIGNSSNASSRGGGQTS